MINKDHAKEVNKACQEVELKFYNIISKQLPENYKQMYSMENIIEGVTFLDIKQAQEIYDILMTCKVNRIYLDETADRLKRREQFINRFAIPRGLTKKDYKKLLKETQDVINNLKDKWRITPSEDGKIFIDLEIEDYISKKEKINKIIKFSDSDKKGELNIAKAKAYPINELLEFKNGFVSCPFHGPENTPSAKLYEKRNKLHCFGCGIDADAIDIFQKLYNLSFTEAVKRLLK